MKNMISDNDLLNLIVKQGKISASEEHFNFTLETSDVHMSLDLADKVGHDQWKPKLFVNDIKINMTEEFRYQIIHKIGELLDDQFDSGEVWEDSDRYNTEINSTFN